MADGALRQREAQRLSGLANGARAGELALLVVPVCVAQVELGREQGFTGPGGAVGDRQGGLGLSNRACAADELVGERVRGSQ